ncbi:MAG TPA: hypothetical protein ENH10_01475, partial [Bacteroidetes bacterium]|nr:hypothetical protein [Bacteroidota bacterium]HEX03816.1 hypothetical protein [Bacteroidota bacterium]
EAPKPVEETAAPVEKPVQQEERDLAPPDPLAEDKPPPSEPVEESRGISTDEPAGEPEAVGDQHVSSDDAPATEIGDGVGAKPGPEGAGLGAVSDVEFAGANAYLSRVEAEVQRRFNFRGRASGKVAEYHFILDRKGKIKDLVLMESSTVPSLDLAARSALMRAKLPPLPASFPHEQLGITYKFYGERSR